MSLPLLLFDLDGVLVHSYECWRSLCRAAGQHFGSPPLTDEAFEAGWGQGVEADVQTWFPGTDPAALSAFYDAHFLEYGADLLFETGGRELFSRLRERGQASAIVTNTQQALAEGVIAAGQLQPDLVVGARPGLASKPAPDLLLAACEGMGRRPSQAWMIGDSRYDAEAAEAAGIRFAGFRRPGERRLEELMDVLTLE